MANWEDVVTTNKLYVIRGNSFKVQNIKVHTNALVEFHAYHRMLVSFIMSRTITEFCNPTACTAVSSPGVHKPVCNYQTYHSIGVSFHCL